MFVIQLKIIYGSKLIDYLILCSFLIAYHLEFNP
jgi:hypothetical protein